MTLKYAVDGPNPIFSFLIYGEEVGESGTPHLQGYFELPKRMTFNVLRRKLVDEYIGNPGIHLEAAKGSQRQNIEYCSKEGKYRSYGEPMEQGKRNDLLDVKKDIDAGMADNELWANHFSNMVRYNGSFSKYKSVVSKGRNFKPRVFIFWGPSGTGKTKRAFAIDPESTWIHGGGN